MKSRTGMILFAILIAFALTGTLSAAVSEKIVEAEGLAEGDSLKARDEAVNRSLRRAIETGVGAEIESETFVRNFQLQDDVVFSQVKGYIKNYEVIDDNKGAGGVYKIRIRATVALGRMIEDIKANRLILSRTNNPKAMILFNETIDGLEQPGNVVQTEFEKLFLKNDFELVDKSQMDMIKDRDATLSYADPRKAAALGRRFGAAVVIVGQAAADLVDTSRPYGVSVFAYGAQVSFRAVKTDTAKVVASDSVDMTERGGGRIPTAKKAIRAAGTVLAKKALTQVMESLRSEAFNTVTVQIVAEGATATRKRDLKRALQSIRGISNVNEREFTNNVLILDVTVDGAIWSDFDATLEELPGVSLMVTGKTQNRIDVRFVSDLAAGGPR
ncbi:MAG: hypothetical protein P9M03_05190 [Candidatus Theseobacter exili]|nr:hypothetical protein [Candidatus Theseobacter exili]